MVNTSENVLGFLGRRHKKGQKRISTEMQEESQQNATKPNLPQPVCAQLHPEATPHLHSVQLVNISVLVAKKYGEGLLRPLRVKVTNG